MKGTYQDPDPVTLHPGLESGVNMEAYLSSPVYLQEFLIYAAYQSFVSYLGCRRLLSVSGLSINVLWHPSCMFYILMWSNLSMVSFVVSAVCVFKSTHTYSEYIYEYIYSVCVCVLGI